MPADASLEFADLQEALAGRYSLDREIGRGGMGIVYLARDVSLDRPVAIKLFPPDLARIPEARARFLQEARTAARLSHPHIVPVHAVEEAGSFVFMVMTFVDGESLTERIARTGPLSPRDATRLIREVAWALAHAHAQGVVHRDVKADNILLETAAGSGRALVSDFGIATSLADGDGIEVTGTPAYMSPEQATGSPLAGRSDLYSLGVVGFLALAGSLPFDGPTPADTLALHLRAPVPRLHPKVPGAPARLCALVERCLAKDPESRPQSAQSLADALETALEARRELPVAVRHFVEQSRRGSHGARVLILLWLLGPIVLLPVAVGSALGPLPGIGVALAIVLAPLGLTVARCRRVLRAGFGHADILRGFERDIEARHDELAFLYGADHLKQTKRLRPLGYALLAAALGLAVAPATGLIALGAGVTSGGATLLGAAGIITLVQADKRSDIPHKRRWKFWKGRIGSWLFRLAGFRLGEPSPAVAFTHRPTEMAIGLSVLGLYQALPAPSREALGDLPGVVKGLETEARRMRERVEELAAIIQDEPSGGREAGDDLTRRREAATDRVRTIHDQAQARLREAVTALETLRVDLLRLQGGSADLGHVTLRLGRARELAADLERLLEGQTEVEEMTRDPSLRGGDALSSRGGEADVAIP